VLVSCRLHGGTKNVVWVRLYAVVIGLAAAGLEASQRCKAIVVGILAATLLRFLFASAARTRHARHNGKFLWCRTTPTARRTG